MIKCPLFSPHQKPWTPGQGRSKLAWLLGALVFLAACGGSNVTTSPQEQSPDVGVDAAAADVDFGDEDLLDFALLSSAAMCTKVFECCTPQERTDKLGMSGTVEQCADQTSFMGFAFGYSQFNDSIKAGRMAMDVGMAELCIGALEETSCARFSATIDLNEYVPGCRDVLIPLVENDEECTHSQECKSGSCAESRPGSNYMICQALPTDGEACPNSICAKDLYCDSFLYDTRTCVPKRETGQGCQNDEQCLSNFCATDPQNNLSCRERLAVCGAG